MYQNIKIIVRFVPIQKFIEEKAIDQIIPLKRDPDQIARSEDTMWIKEELLCLNDIVTALHHHGNHQQA